MYTIQIIQNIILIIYVIVYHSVIICIMASSKAIVVRLELCLDGLLKEYF